MTPPRDPAGFDTGQLDLWALCQKTGTLAVYLHAEIVAAEDTLLPTWVGSDDGCAIWLNGNPVLQQGKARGYSRYTDLVDLPLEAGRNHLLVKVTNAGGAWRFGIHAADRVPQAEINAAIDRGVQALLDRQLLDGSWGQVQGAYRNGATALALFALLSSGVSNQHPGVQRGLEFLRCQPSDRTYSASCELMALAAAREPRLQEQLESCAEDLISWQQFDGLWAYPEGHTDLSCAQFAALGLRAASGAGVEIPDRVWTDLIDGALTCQGKAGESPVGFLYRPQYPNGQTGSMTTAGITILAIAREQLGDRIKPSQLQKVERALEQAMTWMGQEFEAMENPRMTYNWVYYWLYGVERVGALLETQSIGRHDWYGLGAAHLLHRQGGDGHWSDPWGRTVSSTSFALLFLKKATARATTGGDPSEQRDLHRVSEREGRALILHVVEKQPMTLWVDCTLERPPEEVEYWRRIGEGEWESIGSSSGDRWALQLPVDQSGSFELQCRATAPDGTELRSAALTVQLREGISPDLLAYASDSTRNLLPRNRPTVEASSAGGTAGQCVDNRWDTSWTFDADDASPSIEIKLKRKAKAKLLLLSQAHTMAKIRDKKAQVRRVEIYLNREKKPIVVELDADAGRKTVVELPAKSRINRLRIEVVALSGGTLGSAKAGFSEIELQ